jgi:hypothetical protein
MSKRTIASKISKSSLGTKSATAARRSVSSATATKVVARAHRGRRIDGKRSLKSGGADQHATYR